MKRGYLSEHFKGVAAKTLSAVEANPAKSNQHEFNGVSKLKKILGEEKRTLPASFVYLCDEDDEPTLADGFLTWYDARENHVKRSEHRLYFNTSAVSERAEAGDLFVFGLREDGSALAIIAEGGSTAENQVRWLFGLDEDQASFSVQGEAEADAVRLEYASNLILDQIGVERAVVPEAENFLEKILAKFGEKFPATREFSAFARDTLALNPLDNPDGVLIAFMEREEALFRALERHIISERLKTGFDGDVDGGRHPHLEPVATARPAQRAAGQAAPGRGQLPVAAAAHDLLLRRRSSRQHDVQKFPILLQFLIPSCLV